MKRGIVALIAAASLALIVAAVGRAGARSSGQELPAGSFRVSVQEVLRDGDTIVSRVEIETAPGASVRVVSDKPNRGGLAAAAPDTARPDGAPAVVRLTLLGDHVVWKAGQVDALKFMLHLDGDSGRATFSETGPIPPSKKTLADVLSMALEPGVYREGTSAKLVTVGETTYSVLVGGPNR
ncbi:hypothetical protein [Paludisphaera mucosa]|uniref:CHRD domain-containing protein n=1 Tax=Paludisphaera mucosa TaxID=3030827 RepID=A0ABT6FKP8_9BACT|nr:hypothetical protein [Paludisphaera mucosa]MDG3008146.1 hypothetical protein [Paludisphaera mucosa]